MSLFQPKYRSSRTSILLFGSFVNQLRNHKVWATKRKSKTNSDVALEYFDNIYGTVYGKKWPSMRLALLCPHKYCAVVNNYSDIESVSSQLVNEGAMNLRELFEVQKNLLSEKVKTYKRKKDLQHVYNLEKKIEDIAARTRDADLEKIYPDKNEIPFTDSLSASRTEEEVSKEDLIQHAKSPLDKSLAEASIDMNRQIDPSEGFASSRLNEFVPVSKLKGKENFVSEAEHFSSFNDTTNFPVTIEPENTLIFPPHLQIYVFDQGNISEFSPTKPGVGGVLDYYLMDAGSILPVLALGLKPGDNVLDMCSAPGGKSLVCLQTLYPDMVVCNDSSISRLNRLKNVMRQYIYNWEKKITISHGPGTLIEDTDTFSKILVDVPCTNDRHSVMESDNNIFTSRRNKERILLPEQQIELLFHALKLIKKGGTVVYSTCSLNPAQNDGVVHMALRKMWEETSIKIVVKDLSEALEPAKIVFKFSDPECLRYGSLVVPFLPSNFGPMYFCKLQRIS